MRAASRMSLGHSVSFLEMRDQGPPLTSGRSLSLLALNPSIFSTT